ncbi:MAG TPA: UDP-N-acetylglucosamine 2-epimerase (non-hydrolyzing) [Acidimicrobiales bacterium]|nr:UDP-N-acetylglucosamine 2-epimerase (non-hydrolyzing) [Acidimicrobiales bacterium]
MTGDLPDPAAFDQRRTTTADIAVVLGTRPEIIKLAPVARALGPRARLIWTGQHYDFNLVDVFFKGADLAMPLERLTGVGGEQRGDQVVAVLRGLMRLLEADRPTAVVVQGDTNTTNASAQAAHYLGIPVVHVEAGLRSWDREMPEEINRMIVGVVADLHCCATDGNAEILRRAGVPDAAIEVTGNPIVEATEESVPSGAEQDRLLDEYRVEDQEFVLATIHRPENVDNADQLAAILHALVTLRWPVVLPLHPRTARRIEEFGLATLATRLRLVEPTDHRVFLGLAARSRILVSDSGGVQEEATILKKPLAVVRRSTERPEAVDAGFARMSSPGEIGSLVDLMATDAVAARLRTVPCPFGDGHAGERIAAVTCQRVAHLWGRPKA